MRWENRAHFFAVSAQLMRRILVDHARRHNLKRGGGVQHVAMEDTAVLGGGRDENLVVLDDALQALARIDPRKARVVELRFFGGLSVEETAEVLKVSPVTVMRDWSTARPGSTGKWVGEPAMDPERWKRVDELLHSALAVPADRRDEFLRQECAGDAELEQEVRSLLTSHRNLGGFLERPAIKVAAQAIARTEAREAGDSVLGRTISHYRVLGKLGSGGMGVVYEAEDLRLGRRVALKFLPESLAHDERTLQRFEREARVASSLNHPNICTIYEVEEHDHQPVIVMELLEGKSLKERIREGPTSIEELLDFGIQASDALDAAHAKGIIHRDIKPGNIFIIGQVRVKILDFGLAKVTPVEDESEEESLTLAGVIPGTTSYMSPEQVRGEEIDARSDLFSLGVVLYEMATGQRPFIGKNRVLMMNAILNASAAAPSSVNRSLPAALDTIIARALEKKRDKRFQHAADIGSELKRLKRETGMAHMPITTNAPLKPAPRPGYVSIFARELAAIRDRFSEKPVKQVETRPINLPVQRTGFVGREKEVAAAKELLLRNDVRLVTVTGPGGIGKTRLAVQVAGALVERFPGGTHFVSLSLVGDPGIDSFCDPTDVGNPGGRGSVAARNTQEESTELIASSNAAGAGQFRAVGSGGSDRGRPVGRGSQSQNPGNQSSRAACLRGARISRAAAWVAGFTVNAFSGTFVTVPCGGAVRAARRRRQARFRTEPGKRGGGRRNLRPVGRFASRHRTRSGPGQSSFALFHADTPGEPVAATYGRRAGPSSAPADASCRDGLELRSAECSRAEAFPAIVGVREDATWKVSRLCAIPKVISIWICSTAWPPWWTRAWYSRSSKRRVNRDS